MFFPWVSPVPSLTLDSWAEGFYGPIYFPFFVFYFICGFLNLLRLAIYLLYCFFFFWFLWQFCTRGQNWGKVITQASCLLFFFFYLLGGYLSEKVKTWTNKYTNSLFSPFSRIRDCTVPGEKQMMPSLHVINRAIDLFYLSRTEN